MSQLIDFGAPDDYLVPMLSQFFQGFVFALLISLFSFRCRLLTRDGALAQFVLGWIVLALGGWAWTLPIVVFFLTSSALSLLAKNGRRDIELLTEKGSTRDAAQVLANGGVAGVLVIGNLIVPGPVWYLAYLGSVAAAAADTWGTEIGTIFRGTTRLISTFHPVGPGRSGGVSLAGTFGGLAGAILVALSAVVWLPGIVPSALAQITAAGLLGSLLDSLLGATVQSQYVCNACGKITERRHHCGNPTALQTGKPWITNDLVNLVCTFSGGGISAGIRWLTG